MPLEHNTGNDSAVRSGIVSGRAHLALSGRSMGSPCEVAAVVCKVRVPVWKTAATRTARRRLLPAPLHALYSASEHGLPTVNWHDICVKSSVTHCTYIGTYIVILRPSSDSVNDMKPRYLTGSANPAATKLLGTGVHAFRSVTVY